ncbi:hypothetical protein H8K20_11770 [Neobittarella massiliensis]|uniref:Uncharacterized protein n=1 Tax=Neobittarella massiliensis (ex Bilen et al. 2018) TaxID=2041842 RepID=A0A8J6IH91_9FIRM|nr:hypothetical protein [Neobittarella massiliensis]MBC3517070.1 hypothetical protein [Neobittarella massiliensis]
MCSHSVMFVEDQKKPDLYRFRDLTLCRAAGQLLAFACDSTGAVGALPEDDFATDARRAGVFLVKVALMEVIASGAVPVAVYADFCYAPSPHTERVLAGVLDEVRSVGGGGEIVRPGYGTYGAPLCTATGVVVVGQAPPAGLQIACSQPGDLVCTVGRPMDKRSHIGQLTCAAVKALRDCAAVHEILPCGSKGFRYEANTLADTSGLDFCESETYPIKEQAQISCGACACAVFTVAPEDLPQVRALGIPYFICPIGRLTGTRRQEALAPPARWAPLRLTADGSLHFCTGQRIRTAGAMSYAVGRRPRDEWICAPEQRAVELLKQLAASLPAVPFLLIDDLNLPMRPDGERVMAALRQQLTSCGIDPETGFTGSTEDNHPGPQTGMALRLFGWRE